MKPTPGKVVAALFIPVLLYLTYIAACQGLADIYYRPVKNIIERWQQEKVVLKDEDWDRLQQKLETALRFDPDNPDINHAYGTVLQGRYIDLFPEDPVAQPARRLAADYYRLAIKRRPTWPYTWADLALMKYRLGELDEEYSHALHTAIQMGPWEPSVQYMVGFLGFQTWDKLGQKDRAFIIKVIQDSFSHADGGHVGRMLKLTEEYGFLHIFCTLGSDNERLVKYCNRQLKTN